MEQIVVNGAVFYSKIRKNNRTWYEGKCACGNIIKRHASYVQKCVRENKIMSCGCQNKSNNRGILHKNWKGVGELSYQRFKSILRGCKTRARKILISVTIEQCWDLFLQQNRLCALTGRELTMVDIPRHKIISTASLDRKDPNQGYTIDNIWWIHKDLNFMKNNLTVSRVFEIAKLVADNN